MWGLVALPLLAAAIAYGIRRRRAALDRFVGSAMADSLAPGWSWRRNAAKTGLRVVAVAMLLVALAAPRFGSQLVKVEREGIDLVIALDVSLSMLAEDVPPNRLERAKREIADLIAGLEGDRVGIAVFAVEAVALCPLTVDYDAAMMLARSVDIFSVSEPGSAIGDAIEVSTAMFDGSQGGDRAIILVTDGENQHGDPVQAAQAAAEKGIRVFAIGLGSPKGELIPERATDGNVVGYKKDSRGETVLSRLDEDMLRKVAAASGGQYLPATTGGLEITALYDAIAGMQRKLIKGEFVERRKERFVIPLAIALACLLLDALLSWRAGGRRPRALHTGAAALVLALASGLAVPGIANADRVNRGKVRAGNNAFKNGDFAKAYQFYRQALGDTTRVGPDTEGVYYNGGNALYMQNQYGPAVEYYQRSYSPDSLLTGRMLYNRGNALLKGGKAAEAVESYVQALQYLPDDEDARHNLELALAVQQQQQEQQQQQQNQQGEEEQQNPDQQPGQNAPPDSTQNDQQQQQQQDPSQEQEEQQDRQPPQPDSTGTQSQPDSSQAQPQAADSTMAPLSEEQMMQLSPEDAMRILQALQDREQELQKERRRAAFRKLKRSGKDW
jgi:Ca-activated chloride channel family protein